MGIEDVGTIVLLIKNLCLGLDGSMDMTHLAKATSIYEKLRIPRTSMILDCSRMLGGMQENRSSLDTATMEELLLQGEVMMNETLPIMFPGATYNYRIEVQKEFAKINETKQSNNTMDSNRPIIENEVRMNEALATIMQCI